MPATRIALGLDEIPRLLRGDVDVAEETLPSSTFSRFALHLSLIAIGSGCYGAVMGCWRSPDQALYTAIKFPLVIILTTLGNALLNGMIAPLLGSNLGFRQSLQAVFLSFTIAAVVLGSLSPIVYFVVWNIPSPHDGSISQSAYRFMQLVHVLVISCAGIMANLNLFPLLRRRSRNSGAAFRVLFAWLAGNLFLGGQICWILRPFIGRPNEVVHFIGSTPFQGSLYETIFDALRHLLNH